MDEARAKVIDLDLNDILPNRFQPRIKFNEDSIIELSESIKEHGVIQPVVVRPIGDKYEIIAGERRYKASVLAGKETIPAIITNLDDKGSAEVALIENVQRRDLTAIEEAISYKKILDMGYLTQEQLAIKLGKSQSTIANKVRLLNLCDEGQEALMEDKISERHARSLLRLDSFEDQKTMINRIVEERLTVRKTDEEIDRMNNEINPSVESPTNVVNENAFSAFNPGFMNVDEIVSNAEDINKPREEVNFNALLSSGASSGVEGINTVDPFASTEQVPIPAISSAPEMPISPIMENIPDFDVPSVVAPAITEETIPTQMPELEMPFNPGLVEQVSVPASIEAPVVTIPAMFTEAETDNKKFSFADLLAGPGEETSFPRGEIVSSIPETKIEDNVRIDPVVPVPTADYYDDMPSIKPIDMPIPVSTTPIVEDALPSRFLSPETEEAPADEEPTGEEKTIPLMEAELDTQTGGALNHIPEDVRPIIITDYTKQYDPVLPNAPRAVEPIDFRKIINLLRDVCKTIEATGYTVDSEEVDLTDSYQVTIKIDKK